MVEATKNIIKVGRAAWLSLALLFFSTTSFANIDPDLVGVWINKGKRAVIQIEDDGTATQWMIDGRNFRPIERTLLFLGRYKIYKQSGNTFKTTVLEDNPLSREHVIKLRKSKTLHKIFRKPRTFKYEFLFKKRQVTFTDVKSKKGYRFHRNDFKSHEYGSQQLFLNHVLGAEVRYAIKKNQLGKLNKLLSSKRADFLKLRRNVDSSPFGTGNIGDKIWDEVVETNNLKVARIVGKYIGDKMFHHHKVNAKKANKLQMEKLLIDIWEKGKESRKNKQLGIREVLTYSGGFDLASDNAVQYKHILGMNRLTKKYGCYANTTHDQIKRAFEGPFTDEEIAEAKRLEKELAENTTTVYKLTETFAQRCFAKFYQGQPISKILINTKSIPDRRSTNSYVTPLYHFADKMHNNKRVCNFNYSFIYVLLEFGADPAIKPDTISISLAELLYQNANHKGFKKALASKSRPSRFHKARLAEIEIYNKVMQKIGGQPYDPNLKPVTLNTKNIKTAKPAQHSSIQAPAVKAKPTPKQSAQNKLKIKESYWHARIVLVDPKMPIDPNIKALWGKGAYLYLRKDGNIGFNWSTPNGYGHFPINHWSKEDNKLSIKLGDISYTFDLTKDSSSYTTVNNNNGIFRMTIQTKLKGQK